MSTATRTLIYVSQKKILLFALFTFITLVPLTMVHSQFLTGPLVNAMLLLTCVLVGPTEAVILSLFPSPMALMSGLLPVALAPMIPFIMIGNALYVAVFHYLKPRSVILGIVAASGVKFLFLVASVRFVMGGLLASPLVAKLSVMMGWPQFATALAGGAIALLLLRIRGIQREMQN
ncbi:MAG: hypothetical protein WCV62_04330 [Candidatus Peribacteraceae bacterium]|jgi:hypothetical protein